MPNADSSKPRLSVMLANYNHGRYLRESLAAIVSQDYDDFELLVIDDGSTDDSVAIIGEFIRDYPRIIFLRNEENTGGLAAIQKLLDRASGDYLYFAAADDRIRPGFFRKSMVLLEKFPSAGLCSGLAGMITADGRIIGNYLSPVVNQKQCYFTPGMVVEKLLDYGPCFMGNALIYRRSTWAAVGGFHTELGPFADGFAYQAMALRAGACFIPEALADWRRTGAGYSANVYADWEQSLAIINRAEVLMTGQHKNLFPRVYVRKWLRLAHFRQALSAWGDLWQRQNATIDKSRKLMSKWLAPVNWLLSVLLKMAGLLYLLLGIIILLTGIRPPFNWIFRRLRLALRSINWLNPVKGIGNLLGRL
ncbi:MAG: glycosyltransferase family A protein [Candidatus Neomarinimicrobiota bacterium]